MIFCIMTTEKVRSGLLVFPKHYFHLPEKVDAITIYFKFCYEILSQSQKYHRNNTVDLQLVSYFVLFGLVNKDVYAKNKR